MCHFPDVDLVPRFLNSDALCRTAVLFLRLVFPQGTTGKKALASKARLLNTATGALLVHI